MEKQKFEVYAVTKKTVYVLTPEQLKQLEDGKDRTRAIRERNAKLFEKINLRVNDETEQGYEPNA
jgi:tRNA A37 N6-isopentenylltransferase MiaA